MKNLVPEFSQLVGDVAQKSTLVSLVPFPIVEEKPGLIPGHFEIEASTDGKPRVTHIGECTHYVWIDEVRGSLRVRNPSYLVAKSLVNDYISSQLEVGPDAHPALFWLPDVWVPAQVEEKHGDMLIEMGRRQVEWFIRLVRLADDDWQRTRQHYAISDLQRYAARALDPDNKMARPWVFVNQEQTAPVPETQLCPVCGSDIPRGVIVCRYCHAVLDAKRYKETVLTTENPAAIAGKVLRQ